MTNIHLGGFYHGGVKQSKLFNNNLCQEIIMYMGGYKLNILNLHYNIIANSAMINQEFIQRKSSVCFMANLDKQYIALEMEKALGKFSTNGVKFKTGQNTENIKNHATEYLLALEKDMQLACENINILAKEHFFDFSIEISFDKFIRSLDQYFYKMYKEENTCDYKQTKQNLIQQKRSSVDKFDLINKNPFMNAKLSKAKNGISNKKIQDMISKEENNYPRYLIKFGGNEYLTVDEYKETLNAFLKITKIEIEALFLSLENQVIYSKNFSAYKRMFEQQGAKEIANNIYVSKDGNSLSFEQQGEYTPLLRKIKLKKEFADKAKEKVTYKIVKI